MPRHSTSPAARLVPCALIGVAALAGCDPGATPPPTAWGPPEPAAPVGWPFPGGDEGGGRWSPAAQITPENVAGLQEAWSWATGEGPRLHEASGETLVPDKFEATPVVFGDTLLLSTPFNRVVALDARNGRELWAFDPGATDHGLISNDHAGFVHRGVATWTGDGRRVVFLPTRWELVALDAATGRPVASFGDGGRVDLGADLRWPTNRLHLGSTSPPAIWGDLVIVGSAIGDNIIAERDPPGAVQAFDARTGRRVWRWDPVPPPGTPERDSWGDGSAEVSGHGNVWSAMTVDTVRGLVYLPVSAASNDWYGGRRPGDNLYTQSVVALEAATGRLRWYRQIVHHGLWDYDPAAAPVLATARRNGEAVDVVALAGKTGYLYVFDRDTGTPIWPVEERPAPGSTVPGERTSPTQPHPTWPEPFSMQGLGPDDLVDFTPELRARALALLDTLVWGEMFTPPSLEGTAVMPGWIGGAGWGATTVDPGRGLLYVKASNQPVLARLVATGDSIRYRLDPELWDPPAPLRLRLEGARRLLPFTEAEADAWLPVVRPPYGTLTAYDLATGERRWQVTVGDTPELRRHSRLRGLDLPPLGVVGPVGAVATGGGVLFLTGGGTVLHALDAETGAELWSAELDRIGYSNPMSYVASDGFQYVVVATGRRDDAVLRAFRLPDGGDAS